MWRSPTCVTPLKKKKTTVTCTARAVTSTKLGADHRGGWLLTNAGRLVAPTIGIKMLNDFDMPGLETHTKLIILGVADTDVAQILHTFELIGLRKPVGEVRVSPAHPAHIKITNTVIGMPRRSEEHTSELQSRGHLV